MARQQARRQQRERAVGVVIVCLGIVVAVVAVLALREPNGHDRNSAAKDTASSVAKQSHTATPSKNASKARSSSRTSSGGSGGSAKNVPLIVLNNSTIKGLAAEAAQRFENGGWTVTKYGNLTNEIVSTCAYYDDADPSAKVAAEALQAQYPTIKRVEPKFPELPSGPVVVVLTQDYSAA